MLTERPRVHLVVNTSASGVDSVRSTVREACLALERAGAETSAVATRSLRELGDAIEEAKGRRLVLVGGDGAVHAAANAGAQGELALLPAGRANNIARALDIPTPWAAAARIAVHEPSRPLDLLAVSAAGRSLLAVEGFSAGFQAAARSRYTRESSANLGAGVLALLRALVRHRPYAAELDVDGESLSLSTSQLFVSNMPLFGFGFRVAPSADPGDGEADLVVLPPRSRGAILPELARVRRGTHLADGRSIVRRTRQMTLHSPMPLVADAEPLGSATATVEVVPGALRLARPPL